MRRLHTIPVARVDLPHLQAVLHAIEGFDFEFVADHFVWLLRINVVHKTSLFIILHLLDITY